MPALQWITIGFGGGFCSDDADDDSRPWLATCCACLSRTWNMKERKSLAEEGTPWSGQLKKSRCVTVRCSFVLNRFCKKRSFQVVQKLLTEQRHLNSLRQCTIYRSKIVLGQMVGEKWYWTEQHGQNGTDEIVNQSNLLATDNMILSSIPLPLCPFRFPLICDFWLLM